MEGESIFKDWHKALAIVVGLAIFLTISAAFEDPDLWPVIATGVVVIIFAFLYISPSLLSWRMKHPHTTGIFLLNLVTGWTLIGWVVCIAWIYFWKTPETEPPNPFRTILLNPDISPEITLYEEFRNSGILSTSQYSYLILLLIQRHAILVDNEDMEGVASRKEEFLQNIADDMGIDLNE